jgi:nicotinate-nucleotide--dimethylbenzimidazole phosphoribosyltransferase
MSLLDATLLKIVPQDAAYRQKARARLEQLTMPYWALGRVMDLAIDLAGMTRSMSPAVARRIVVIMAGDHGVTAEGVSKYPQEVTAQMVYNFLGGGAGVNACAKVSGASVLVVNMGVAAEIAGIPEGERYRARPIGAGTANMAQGPAMSRDDAIRSIETGIEIALELGPSFDVFATGDMGIGNTTPSSAIIAAFTGVSAAEAAGRGTGIDDEQFDHKVSVIEKVLSVNKPDPGDALDVLAKVGGFEIGGVAGLVLGAASLQKPTLIDGLISSAGALIANGLCPAVNDYLIAGHLSVERGHGLALRRLNKKPLLDLDLRLGEGTGAVLAMPLVEAAVRVLTEMATFEEAAVSTADK